MVYQLAEREFQGWIVIVGDKVLEQKAGINGSGVTCMHKRRHGMEWSGMDARDVLLPSFSRGF